MPIIYMQYITKTLKAWRLSIFEPFRAHIHDPRVDFLSNKKIYNGNKYKKQSK